MWDIVLDALVDSAKTLPFLLIIYLFIEFLESNKRARDKTVKLLNGKCAPLVAGAVGIVPQCGFSVMATDLYLQNYLKTGTLIAFFVATSDEALPLLLSNGKTVGVVWIVVLVKIVYAVILGYIINVFDKRPLADTYEVHEEEGCCGHELNEDAVQAACNDEKNCDEVTDNGGDEHSHEHNHEKEHAHGKFAKFLNFVKHPLLHTTKIFVYIFVVNAVFGLLLYYFEQPITQFTAKLGIFQSFFTAAIGLVPNCASSVILTGMYASGNGSIIGLPALLAGLVANSGIALAILFKNKTNFKRNLLILAIMYFAGVLCGIASEVVCMLL